MSRELIYSNPISFSCINNYIKFICAHLEATFYIENIELLPTLRLSSADSNLLLLIEEPLCLHFPRECFPRERLKPYRSSPTVQ